MQFGPGHEILVPPDPGDLPAVDRVGDHLSIQVDRERAVDRHQVGITADGRGVVDHRDIDEGHIVVAVEPVVEPGCPQREGGDGHSLEDPLAGIADLSRQVQLHQAGREHFRMDAEPTQWSRRQRRGDHVRYGADPCLERRSIDHEAQGMARNLVVPFVGRRILEGEWLAIGLDEHVDQFDGDGVVEFGQTTPGARQVGIGLNDQESIGVAAGPEELRPGGPVVKGEVDRAAGVRWGGLRHHDPWREALQNRERTAGTRRERARCDDPGREVFARPARRSHNGRRLRAWSTRRSS